MALNNILREPRREVTETLVGGLVVVSVLVAILVPDYYIALFLESSTQDDNGKNGMPITLGMVLGFMIMVFTVCIGALLLRISHNIGEDICEKLQAHGWHLRPKERVTK